MFGKWTYIIFELGWALPVILLQAWFGWPVLRRQWRLYLAAVLIPTLWLSAADRLAIGVGIWTISLERSLGIFVFGLPLEEAVFFLITNILIVQGLILLSSRESWARLRSLLQRFGVQAPSSQVQVRRPGRMSE